MFAEPTNIVNPSHVFEEKHMKFLMEDSVERYCIAGNDGYFKTVNNGFVRSLGWTKEELCSKPYIEFVHPEDVYATQNATSSLISGIEVLHFENRYRCEDGKYKWLVWNAYPIAADCVFICRANEISQQKQEFNRLKLFESIFDSSNEGIIIFDANKKKALPEIVSVNKKLEEISGFSSSELIGNNFSVFFSINANLNETFRLAKCFEEQLKGDFEISLIKKNKNTFIAQLSLTPIFNKDNQCINWFSIIKDVSEARKQSLSLEESESKFRSLVENSPIGVFIIFDQSLKFNNEALTKITGYTLKEVQNLYSSIIHPNFHAELNSKKISLLKGQTFSEQIEISITSKSGEFKFISIYGSRTIYQGKPAIIGSIIDITKQKENFDNLRKFSLLVEQSFASIVITDLSGSIEYVNPAFTIRSGYTLEEALGQNPRILKTEKTDPLAYKQLWENLTHDKPWSGVFCNKRKSGELYWEQVIISPFFNEKGEKTNYVAIKEEITDKVQLTEEREQLIIELTKSLNELKQFSYITSHNLRAPVTNLMGILDLIDPSNIQDETTLNLIEGFRISTHKINETLQDLIKSIVLRENVVDQFEQIPFENLIKNVQQNLSIQILESKTTLIGKFDLAPTGHFNPVFIESIFQNLITNAIKYAKPGVAPIIEITSNIVDNKLELVFSDNGIGMDLEKVGDRIFGLYQRFHQNHDGKGMGLFLVKSHVKAMGGDISVESKVNIGTKFILTFEV